MFVSVSEMIRERKSSGSERKIKSVEICLWKSKKKRRGKWKDVSWLKYMLFIRETDEVKNVWDPNEQGLILHEVSHASFAVNH